MLKGIDIAILEVCCDGWAWTLELDAGDYVLWYEREREKIRVKSEISEQRECI